MALDRAVQLAARGRRGAADAAAVPLGAPDGDARALPGRVGRRPATSARDDGVDVVRRFTGGRGVLHDDELTYSIVARTRRRRPARHRRLVPHPVRGAGRGVPRARRRGGADERDRAATASSAACYLHATAADLSLGGAQALGLRAGLARLDRAAARLVHRVARRRREKRASSGLAPGDAADGSPTRP